jgi:hypothetical protein
MSLDLLKLVEVEERTIIFCFIQERKNAAEFFVLSRREKQQY